MMILYNNIHEVMSTFNIVILIVSSILILINLLSVDFIYKKLISYFYFSTNVIFVLIVASLYYQMFKFMLYIGILSIIINVVIILTLLYNKTKKGVSDVI